MGATLDSLREGDWHYCYVVAIEGYPYLLTDAPTLQAAIDAWAGTDFTQALGGLYVDLQHKQEIDPYEPLRNKGGSCIITVVDETGDDTFGIDTHRKFGGAESELTTAVGCADDELGVKSTTGFAASGEAWIGVECFSYDSKDGNSFIDCVRGRYSPFAAGGSELERFAHGVRAGTNALSVKLGTLVTSLPRIWEGRLVGVWMHAIRGGVLDTKADAHLVYAGRIAEPRDDGRATVIEVEHLLESMEEVTIGRSLWTGRNKEGVYLGNSAYFSMSDFSGSSSRTANHLVFKDAPGAGELPSGYYSTAQIHNLLIAWWAAERDAGRLWGTYTISVDLEPKYTFLGYEIPDGGGDSASFSFFMPTPVAILMGFDQAIDVVGYRKSLVVSGTADVYGEATGVNPALRSVLFKHINGQDGLHFEIAEETGAFVDQFDTMPASLRPGSRKGPNASGPDFEWGIFVVDDKVLMRGAKVGSELRYCHGSAYSYGNAFTANIEDVFRVPWSDGDGMVSVRQVLIYELTFALWLKALAYSTGTPGYNHATHDVLPHGVGLGIPAELLGWQFDTSVDGLPGSDHAIAVVLDKPTTMGDLLQGDLVLRRAFTRWKQGRLEFGTWQTPTTEAAEFSGGGSAIVLSEDNKAEPANNESDHRTASTQTRQWRRSIVKIYYGRDFTKPGDDDGNYRSWVTLEDRGVSDMHGGVVSTVTIKARNTYTQYASTGAGIESLIPNYLATMPMFTRAGNKKRRSIDPRLWEGVSVGDVVVFADDHSRDPETGQRGITSRAALVVELDTSPGGQRENATDDSDDATGEVTLFFTERNELLAGALYAPSADVDVDANAGGFTAGYDSSNVVLRTVARAYNQSAETEVNGQPVLFEDVLDASYFPIGSKFKLVEKDPIVADDPLVWEGLEVTDNNNTDLTFTPALSPAFDATKTYRIVPEDYDDATTLQRARAAFQGDDADGLILDSSGPYSYQSLSADRAFEGNTAAPIELLPDSTMVDGAARDAGHESALVRLLDHNIDYKTAIQSVLMTPQVLSNTTFAGYLLVAFTPVFLTPELLTGALIREFTLDTFLRSTDGTATSLRVTLARSRPLGSTLQNVNRGQIYAEGIWSTSSTSWGYGGDRTFSATVKNAGGKAWLLIECAYKCETRCISKFVESVRTERFFGI